jgi:2-polyprenyl-3-methyl-5-hydroxy-6-metoxy-1,4-benzoquinol methylase
MDISNPVDRALKILPEKLSVLNLKDIGISDYNQKYLNQYIKDYRFYAGLYRQLLTTAIQELTKPIEESVFVDYGGGCGFLSMLAKETGFKTVIYCDIYDISCNDAQIIAEKAGIRIDHFITGSIEELVAETKQIQIYPDLICSFDVLEHIYNLEDFFRSVTKINDHFSLVFMTSATPYNPFIKKRLMKMQRTAEFQGTTEFWGMKKRDIKIPFLQARKQIIQDLLPETDDKTLNLLASQTRGLDISDISKEIEKYKETGMLLYKMKHPTNTCDPYTGNWTENLIDIEWLKSHLSQLNFQAKVSSGIYGFTTNKRLNFVKSILNFIIRRTGKIGLFLSPSYMLKAKI